MRTRDLKNIVQNPDTVDSLTASFAKEELKFKIKNITAIKIGAGNDFWTLHNSVFEAKKQGAGGNAIERWFKNNYICRLISPFVSYVTFATGPGASVNGVIPKTLNVAHSEGVDRLNFGGNSLLLKVEGFTDCELKAIMIETLEEALNP
jgi:hypothetical protein